MMTIPTSSYLDLHCHRQPPPPHPAIISLDANQDQLESSGYYYSLGLHPWFLTQQTYQAGLLILQTALTQDKNLLAIGECGLDKTTACDFSLQLAAFNSQILLAEYYQKPLIIHCVKAFNELMQLKKQTKPRQAWIIHGFNRNPALAGQLLTQGFYLSLGHALLNPNSHAAQLLPSLPLQQLFLETDTAELPISAIYAAAANRLGLPVNTLQQQILDNFNRVFLHD